MAFTNDREHATRCPVLPPLLVDLCHRYRTRTAFSGSAPARCL
jgi:hypothetical protein